MGLASLALTDLLSAQEGARGLRPLDARPGHVPARARRVIHIFANGGPSQVDTFDPKPALEKVAGTPLPPQYHGGNIRKSNVAWPSPFRFRKHGQSGMEISELFPNVARCADDLCVIRSMQADDPNHEPGLLQMNCGEERQSRPSLGSWVTYGLGSENENLPGFVVLCPNGLPVMESRNWQAAFLPGTYQATRVDTQVAEPEKLIENLRNGRLSPPEQEAELSLLRDMNDEHRRERAGDPQLDARIQSFELAYRMQSEALDAFDISREPKPIRELYGPGTQGRQLLMARRLVERGVRYVQVYTQGGNPWDNHGELVKNLCTLARDCDQAIAALLVDLKRRGMLDETLVIWGGEFGRTPTAEAALGKNAGRDHQTSAFSLWLAGGGVRPGHVHGETDAFGVRTVRDRVHVHDLHATILHLMGLDHEKLTYRYAGRDFRLTDVSGRVVREVLA
jgi:hypothetical protein